MKGCDDIVGPEAEYTQDYPQVTSSKDTKPFSIYFFTKAKGGYEIVMQGIYEGLVSIGWKLVELNLYKGSREEDVNNLSPLEVLLIPFARWRRSSSATLLKDDRHVFIWTAYNEVFDDGAPPHGIEIISHNTFFDSPGAFNELKTFFSHLHFPETTVVTGDTFHTFMDVGKTWLFMWEDQASVFNWIDTMKCSMWKSMVNSFPAMEENLLARAGEHCIVAMGKSPFVERDEKVKVSPTAQRGQMRKPKSYLRRWFARRRSP